MNLIKINYISSFLCLFKLDYLLKLFLGKNILPVKLLAYHRIADIKQNAMPHESELISATPEQFEKQLKYLSRTCRFTTFKELADEYKANPHFEPENMVILTFDDGYIDFYTRVFPLLKKYKATAVVFVPTGCIDVSEQIWYDRMAHIINKLDDFQFSQLLVFIDSDLDQGRDSINSRNDLFYYMRRIPNKKRLTLFAKIIDYCQAEFKINGNLNEMLNWEQIKELSEYGVEIASHAVSHPVLTQLDSSELEYELGQSKSDIERVTGSEVVSIAYPFGGYDAYSENVINAVNRAGYKFGITYIDGTNARVAPGMYTLKRIRVEPYLKFSSFKIRFMFLPFIKRLSR